MNTILQKWGNSQGIRLPKAVIARAGLTIGSEVEIELSENAMEITIRPARPSRPMRGRYRIEDLVARIPPDSAPGEVDWGDPRGEETW